MTASKSAALVEVLTRHRDTLLTEWLNQHLSISLRRGLATEAEMSDQFRNFLNIFSDTLAKADTLDASRPEWEPVRAFLADMSAHRARQGFTPVETATFVFSLKQPLYARLREEYASQPQELADMSWTVNLMLDSLGLYTTEVFQRSREAIIARQQEELLELSTPVVQLWDGILALPLIGTLDSARTQVVMESLLEKIVETGAAISIIDITGVPTVDTLVAQHLLKTVAAARLMGADCIISGIRPQIAQTIVHLGVDLTNVITKSTLADAFIIALQKSGSSIPTRAAG
ncbi:MULTISPECIES: STAS domain-containing protein [Paraburkholderia]|jgi:rsbT co-antagonist protein RsbR|uniref:Anti-sigma-factor antagonist n=1 Tax=Paraburkholderia hospita TaxID=169430 RepID=A0AAJ4X1L6_9BURK|nr:MULTISPECIES: STAS domain-containing protein [Paraburkholderia]EUC21451.1 anti-sigma-factor antagonist for Sigma B [Burkholderia sp. BT03]SKC67078.1 Anti-anti-sigma regulatory factor (antagonist of anti-sigma factor) [Burkholderia sp. CF099]AUT67057.1 STAS domain-containing protein [Paraburkholderia hospita]AXE97151.1 anti-anti-sigma factor [Paraburkholderia hospita]EIN00456.1 anti-sigma-factor antagonist [Paraburkholderia hospita]